MDPDKWAGQMEDEIREREKADAGKDEIFLAKRKLLDSQAPLLWKQLTRTLGDLARAYNKRRNILTVEDEGEQFAVRRNSDAGRVVLSAMFFHLENRIGLTMLPGDWFRNYHAKVIPGEGEGTACLVWDDPVTGQKSQRSIDEIATEAMEAVLKNRP
jgi:hypothetical protein